MPINVKHAPDVGGLAALALLAGQLSGDARRPQAQIYNPPRIGGGGGGGGGSYQSPSAYDKLDTWHVTESMRANQIMEEASQAQRETWKYEYTEKQKMERARREEARRKLAANPNFTPQEKERYLKLSQLEDLFDGPIPREKTDEELQMEQWTQEGKGIGQEWEDEWGNVKTRKPTGEIVTQAPFEKTRKGLEMKAQMDREKQLNERRSQLFDQMSEGLSDDKNLSSVYGRIDKILRHEYPWYDQQIRDAVVAAQAQDREAAVADAQAAVVNEGLRQLLQGGEAAQEPARPQDLPPEVADAHTFLEMVGEQFPGGIPDARRDLLILAKQASDTISEYEKPTENDRGKKKEKKKAGWVKRMEDAMDQAARGRWGGYG